MNKKKFGAKTRKIMKQYWKAQKGVTDLYWGMIENIQKDMQKATKIPNIEFFVNDGEIVGIGTADRSMELLWGEVLE